MLNLGRRVAKWSLQRFSTAINGRRILDEGDWFYSGEWWAGGSASSRTVFREVSQNGNGVVTVVAHPCSKPDRLHWGRTERWLDQRYAEMHPGSKNEQKFKVCAYEWRTLHFNENTLQSAVKVMSAYRENDPDSFCIIQQAHCLAIPYVKSMVSAGLTTISLCNSDLMKNAVEAKQNMKILCIGHGGGSIPLYLASKIRGAVVHIVEIDPIVISASTQAMGFPALSIMNQYGKRALPKSSLIENLMWRGTHERLHLFNLDAEKFILDDNSNVYDLVFIDAYDGEDIFPRKLWDPHSPFIQNLKNRIHPRHGTVVVNLHSDVDLEGSDSNPQDRSFLSMGKYTYQVCRAYRDVLLEGESSMCGLAYMVPVPWLCNISLVVCRGLGRSKDSSGSSMVLNALIAEALEVDRLVGMPFSCLQYIKRGFTPVG
ncbi:S-adenosyl-L-methionine-dependent methyltransferases superfamily protein [Striga hermonthica]|uniref:S-adenosyl-L-methionine-dependent methyltransferases superfamily protein n=1 Tax=Striga hermonthica TaxID=68872 RepID=A0A9N7MVW8_STRHE|nr:S-adenosyl-L-methionine-dependent methyltransferases superfamily protein [Striga hermonthica]